MTSETENVAGDPTPAHRTSAESILRTCPEELRGRWQGMAERAAAGPGTPKGLRSAIRLKCLECVAWQQAEVSRCEIRTCALWSWR